MRIRRGYGRKLIFWKGRRACYSTDVWLQTRCVYGSKYFDRGVSDDKTRGRVRQEEEMHRMCRLRSIGECICYISQRKTSLMASKNTEGVSCKYGTVGEVARCLPPPTTTNRTTPRVQRPIGDCFANFSLRDAFMGFFPARALLVNCSFLCRISRELVDLKLHVR